MSPDRGGDCDMRALVLKNGAAVAILAAVVLFITAANLIKAAPDPMPVFPYGEPPR
jgi:hypothetical protein